MFCILHSLYLIIIKLFLKYFLIRIKNSKIFWVIIKTIDYRSSENRVLILWNLGRRSILFSHKHKVIMDGMLIGKEIADAYARSLTAGAPRKSDRIRVPGSLSTIDIPQIPKMIVRVRRIINHTSISELNTFGIPKFDSRGWSLDAARFDGSFLPDSCGLRS